MQNEESRVFLPQAVDYSITERRDISRSEGENEIAWLEFSQKSLYNSVEIADEMGVAMPVGTDRIHERRGFDSRFGGSGDALTAES